MSALGARFAEGGECHSMDWSCRLLAKSIVAHLFMNTACHEKAYKAFAFKGLNTHMNKQSRHKAREALFLVYHRMFPSVLVG